VPHPYGYKPPTSAPPNTGLNQTLTQNLSNLYGGMTPAQVQVINGVAYDVNAQGQVIGIHNAAPQPSQTNIPQGGNPQIPGTTWYPGGEAAGGTSVPSAGTWGNAMNPYGQPMGTPGPYNYGGGIKYTATGAKIVGRTGLSSGGSGGYGWNASGKVLVPEGTPGAVEEVFMGRPTGFWFLPNVVPHPPKGKRKTGISTMLRGMRQRMGKQEGSSNPESQAGLSSTGQAGQVLFRP